METIQFTVRELPSGTASKPHHFNGREKRPVVLCCFGSQLCLGVVLGLHGSLKLLHLGSLLVLIKTHINRKFCNTQITQQEVSEA